MVWPFTKKLRQHNTLALSFKDGQSFFEYACRYGQTDIVLGRGVVALVLDGRTAINAPTATKRNDNGSQLVALRIASPAGGFMTIAQTPGDGGDTLAPGDVVIWVPYELNKQLAAMTNEKHLGYVGLVRAKIAPELGSGDDFAVLCKYT